MVAILTLTLYLALSATQVVIVHFCHGNLQSIALNQQAASCCGDSEPEHKGCCEDLIIQVDFDSDHIYSEEISIDRNLIADSGQNNTLQNVLAFVNMDECIGSVHAPPFRVPKLYQLNAAYLFYG